MAWSPGRYVNAGAAVFALIDSDTFRVEGYFEESKLRRIHGGEDATAKLIGDARVLSGHVKSIAYCIEDQNRTTSSELLAFVNPTFSWVRLATHPCAHQARQCATGPSSGRWAHSHCIDREDQLVVRWLARCAMDGSKSGSRH